MNLLSGPIIAVESTQIMGKVQLNRIPKPIQDNKNFVTYNLLGCVIYDGAGHLNAIGHYRAVAYRIRRKWIVYDDLKDKSQEIRDTSLVLPALLLYIR